MNFSDLSWGYFQYLTGKKDADAKYLELYKLAVQEKDANERIAQIQHNKQYAVYVEVLLNSYVTNIEGMVPEALSLRLMKSCVYNHFTVFVLKKHSPYTKFLNEKIIR